jgi:general secretion pathway protein G
MVFRIVIGKSLRPQSGFTLIELLVVMAIIAVLLSVAVPRYGRSVDDAREAALKSSLAQMREAIDRFHADRGSYPEDLPDLVDKRYLRSVPIDPITDSNQTWQTITPPGTEDITGVYDVRSGADGSSRSGEPYANW